MVDREKHMLFFFNLKTQMQNNISTEGIRNKQAFQNRLGNFHP